MIITISGNPGSGKSTVAKLLAEKIKYKYYSIGNLRRKMAEERGLSLEQFNKLGEENIFTDEKVDMYQKKLGETEDNFVIEGRTGWYFIPNSFKVFLDVNEKVGAERIFKDILKSKRPDESEFDTLEKVLVSLKKRVKSDVLRYKKYYGINYKDEKNYDVIIDTTKKTPEETVKEILNYAKIKNNSISDR